MNYIVDSISCELNNPYNLPVFTANMTFLPEDGRECAVIEKAFYGTNYQDVTKLGLIFDSFSKPPSIKNVYFNPPATVVLWDDGTKTVVKCQGDDTYSKETGLALCIAKKVMGNKSSFNDIFRKWIPEEKEVSKEELKRRCHTCRYYRYAMHQKPCRNCTYPGYSNWKPAK